MPWTLPAAPALAVLVAVAAVAPGCGGGSRPHARRAAAPEVAAGFAAARWLPARPTYAIVARTVRDAQRALNDAIDSFGALDGLDPRQVSAKLRELLAVDALSPAALRELGVDVDGGIAVFSDEIDPTVVVHLSDPAQTRAFLEDQRARTHVTSQLVGDVELFGVRVERDLEISWALDGDWLWVHFTLGRGHGTAWFSASHAPGAPRWTAAWQRAGAARPGGASPAVIGFLDVHAALERLPHAADALACGELFAPIRGVGVAITGDGTRAGLELSVELDPPAAATLGRALAARPAGWEAEAAGAALAVEWNLDLPAVAGWLPPCARALLADALEEIDELGIRSGRALVRALDLDAKDGQGAVALELASSRHLAALLDRIPMRSHLESSRRFGAYEGKHLAIPFGPEVDYVLTDHVALAGIGDGVLARVVGTGAPQPGPVLAIDVHPGALPVATWAALFELGELPRATWLAERLAAWRAGHLAIRIDGSRLVLEARGERR